VEIKNLDVLVPDDQVVTVAGINWRVPGDLTVEQLAHFLKAQQSVQSIESFEDLAKVSAAFEPAYECLARCLVRETPVTVLERLQHRLFRRRQFETRPGDFPRLGIGLARVPLLFEAIGAAFSRGRDPNRTRLPGRLPTS